MTIKKSLLFVLLCSVVTSPQLVFGMDIAMWDRVVDAAADVAGAFVDTTQQALKKGSHLFLDGESRVAAKKKVLTDLKRNIQNNRRTIEAAITDAEERGLDKTTVTTFFDLTDTVRFTKTEQGEAPTGAPATLMQVLSSANTLAHVVSRYPDEKYYPRPYFADSTYRMYQYASDSKKVIELTVANITNYFREINSLKEKFSSYSDTSTTRLPGVYEKLRQVRDRYPDTEASRKAHDILYMVKQKIDALFPDVSLFKEKIDRAYDDVKKAQEAEKDGVMVGGSRDKPLLSQKEIDRLKDRSGYKALVKAGDARDDALIDLESARKALRELKEVTEPDAVPDPGKAPSEISDTYKQDFAAYQRYLSQQKKYEAYRRELARRKAEIQKLEKVVARKEKAVEQAAKKVKSRDRERIIAHQEVRTMVQEATDNLKKIAQSKRLIEPYELTHLYPVTVAVSTEEKRTVEGFALDDERIDLSQANIETIYRKLSRPIRFAPEYKGQQREEYKHDFHRERTRELPLDEVKDKYETVFQPQAETLLGDIEKRLAAIPDEEKRVAEEKIANKKRLEEESAAQRAAEIQQEAKASEEIVKGQQTRETQKEFLKNALTGRNAALVAGTIAAGFGGAAGLNHILKVLAPRLFKERPKIVDETSIVSGWQQFFGRRKKREASRLHELKVSKKLGHEIQKLMNMIKRGDLKNYIFYGPPGTGKTMAAKEIAKAAGIDYIIIKGPAFEQLPIAEAIVEMNKLFYYVRKHNKKVIVFFDEADAVLGDRTKSSATPKMIKLVNTFLSQVEGPSDPNIMFIFATNLPTSLDKAVRSRVAHSGQVYFGPPTKELREQILATYIKKHLEGRGIEVSPALNLSAIAHQTDGMVGRDLEQLVRDAGDEWYEEQEDGEDGEKAPLSAELFKRVIAIAKANKEQMEAFRL